MKKCITGAVGVAALWLAAPATLRAEMGGAESEASLQLPWLLMSGFLVFFMQTGFALVETGLVRPRNVAHTMAMNVVVFSVGTLGFWACGYAILAGTGRDGLFLSGVTRPAALGLFLFHLMFMDTAATVPTGPLAERWKFLSFVGFGFFMSMLVYPVYAYWVWGDGWLARLGADFGLGHGHVDFAGSSVVHMTGGIAALVGIWFVGPRKGKFRLDGTPNPMPAHNIPMYMTGTLVLAFGWFGFNTGAALAHGDAIAARVAVNTALAAAAGAFVALCVTWHVYRAPDPSFFCNGVLAGLVAVTAPCAFVTPLAAVFIGAVAGVLVVAGAVFVERRLRLDDPVGAVSVHGIVGIWGILAVGLFADGTYAPGANFNGVPGHVTGLLYGNPRQLAAEVVGILANLIWVAPVTLFYFWAAGRLIGNRVNGLVELQGLDLGEMGAQGYVWEDDKGPVTRNVGLRPLEPRPASQPPIQGKPFVVVVEGAAPAELRRIWSGLSQKAGTPAAPDFLAVYPYMTTMQDNRFRFRGGEAEKLRASLERLFRDRLNGQPVQARIED